MHDQTDSEIVDLMQFTPVAPEDARSRIYIAVLMHLEKLRWAPWKKGMTVESVLRQHGVEAFARDVAENVFQGNVVLMRGPPTPAHSIGTPRKT